MFGKKEYQHINQLLNDTFEKLGVLIAVHRGTPGGNIVENTIPALNIALQLGGDLLEIDVVNSIDNKLYVFHDGNENRLLRQPDNIRTMDSAFIESLTYLNNNYMPTSYKVERLEDVLAYFKGDALINIDRAWEFWPLLLETLDRSEMINQIILKGPVVREQLEYLNSYENKYMFMPIVHSLADIETVLGYTGINLVGMELIADTESHPMFQDDVILKLHDMNLFVWANAITLHDELQLFAKLDDDISLVQDPELGWGRLLDKKIDIIQTDWPALLASYRSRKLGSSL